MAVIFDTETSGLVENRTLRLERQPYITEFYACDVDLATGVISREHDTLIKPVDAKGNQVKLEPKITKITGITDEMLADQQPFSYHAEKIRAFLERTDLVIAHNLSFDKDMVEIEFDRLEQKIVWPRGLCTVEQTVGMKGFRLSLSLLHQELFGEPFAGSHRAKADVAALTRCCVELRKREMI
jgi:DNA polymerase-3 subunit alpha